MMWEDWNDWNDDDIPQPEEEPPSDSHLNFDFLSLLSKPKDYYGILEVDYDATEDAIRSNYIRLALKWHPDKQKDPDNATLRFQEINEAYQERPLEACNEEHHALIACNVLEYVLSDPVKRREYDKRKGLLHVYDYNMIEYLDRNKGLILTCNGLGIRHSIF